MNSPVLKAVLDTNIVLDLFLFQDPRTQALREKLQSGLLDWIATPAMRCELERVLTYGKMTHALGLCGQKPQDILSQFDRWAKICSQPIPQARYVCNDTNDQSFIDLACALAAEQSPGLKPTIALLTKDKAILSMRKRLLKLTVFVSSSLPD